MSICCAFLLKASFTNFSLTTLKWNKSGRKVFEFSHCAFFSQLTPKAEYLFVRLLSTWSRKTSDWGRGGFLGLRITLTSCLISSSKSLESEDTDNTLGPIQELSSWSWTWSWASLEFDVVQCWSMSQESDFRGQPWSDPWSRSQPEKKGINANWNLRSLSSTVLSLVGPEVFDGKKDHQGHEGHDLCANNKKEGRLWQHYDLCTVWKLRKITTYILWRSFLQNFVKLIFLFICDIELIHEIFSCESKFSVFPRCSVRYADNIGAERENGQKMFE